MTTVLDKTALRNVALEHKEEISDKLFNYFLDMLESYLEENGEKINQKGNRVIHRDENVLYERVTQILLEIGIPTNLRGFHYLRNVIILCCNDHEFEFGAITKTWYPEIAEMWATTPMRVERAIRHAIEVGFTRGNTEILNRFFSYTVNKNKGRPTNSEFIFTIVDKLKREDAMQKRNV